MARALPRIGYGGGLSGDAVWVEVALALKGLASMLGRKLGQNRKSVIKVVTLKNMPGKCPHLARPNRMDIPRPRAACNHK